MRKLVLLSVVLGSLMAAPAADAAITDVFGGDVACSVDTDGVRECGSTSPRSTTETFDGVPLDVNVAFPPDDGGDEGPFPLIVWGHGYGGAKLGFGAPDSTSGLRRFTSRGYAVMSMTTRGFRESCGSAAAQAAEPGTVCEDIGYLRLMDTRYEVRDYQYLAGVLVDEGLVVPDEIGALGGSYGGGLSMALGALKDRVMLPDGTYDDFESPAGNVPMEIAGATPNIPWTDLAYSLVPNGATLDYVTDSPYDGRFGIMKRSLVNGLYFSGEAAPGYYSETDPAASLPRWFERLNEGEPYDGTDADDIIEEITAHHSSYYIDGATSPAPMLISSGFTDDLFPVDEALRFYNRTRLTHPSTPISVIFGDFGHQRSANKTDVSSAVVARENAWLDFYVKGEGAQPPNRAEAWTQTCPQASSTPSGGPFTAPTWAQLAKGELRIDDASARTISPLAGDAAVDATFDPVSSGGNPCRTAGGADIANTATYRLPAMSAAVTMMGAATVVADINTPFASSQIAARLLDVAPNGTETLVSRTLMRPAAGQARQVFQLHPNGWEFAAGHVPKLELLPKDAGGSPFDSYGRASDGQGPITISNFQVRIPVIERPGAAGGQVKVLRDKFVPAGRTLSPDFAAIANDANATIAGGKLKVKGKTLRVGIGSPADWEAAHASIQVFAKVGKKGKKGKKKRKKGRKRSLLIASGSAVVPGGTTGAAALALNRKALKKLKGGKTKVTVRLVTAEQDGEVAAKRVAQLPKKKKRKKKRRN